MKKINVIILIMILAALTTLVACTPDISYADPKVVSLTVTGITKTDYICSDVYQTSPIKENFSITSNKMSIYR